MTRSRVLSHFSAHHLHMYKRPYEAAISAIPLFFNLVNHNPGRPLAHGQPATCRNVQTFPSTSDASRREVLPKSRKRHCGCTLLQFRGSTSLKKKKKGSATRKARAMAATD